MCYSDQPRITIGEPGTTTHGGYITRLDNLFNIISIYYAPWIFYIFSLTKDGREDEMDENIQQVSTIVANLRNMVV